MKDNKLLYFLLLGIGVSVSIYLFSLRDAERYDLNFLKDKELILKKRIKSLTAQRREIMNFSNIYNFSDSAYSSLVARIEKGSSLVLLIPENPCLDCIMKEYHYCPV